MGTLLFDDYSLIHVCMGFISNYFFNILGLSFGFFIMIHTLFELLENTIFRNYLNKINWWPGGKYKSDRLINSIGDTISAIIGWKALNYLDLYVKYYM